MPVPRPLAAPATCAPACCAPAPKACAPAACPCAAPTCEPKSCCPRRCRRHRCSCHTCAPACCARLLVLRPAVLRPPRPVLRPLAPVRLLAAARRLAAATRSVAVVTTGVAARSRAVRLLAAPGRLCPGLLLWLHQLRRLRRRSGRCSGPGPQGPGSSGAPGPGSLEKLISDWTDFRRFPVTQLAGNRAERIPGKRDLPCWPQLESANLKPDLFQVRLFFCGVVSRTARIRSVPTSAGESRDSPRAASRPIDCWGDSCTVAPGVAVQLPPQHLIFTGRRNPFPCRVRAILGGAVCVSRGWVVVVPG